ncbi:Response regulator PleD [Pseudooctadecabacter jejudonensis]|uniref:diguanylate cyclase n=1 Tax=Pseudooctadecabacter jejudonensis TaxID=1391910 RepID=A0A1Y5RD17_9RHOB|nr:Response regulator PleD [Pseudooctadecabacter jejudonensis]
MRFSILTALKVFAPRTARQVVLAFAFWQVLFGIVYLLLLAVFGQLGRAPLAVHLTISFLLCTPFLSITMMLVRQHLQRSLKFKNLAGVDALTGLRNRRAFVDQANARHDPDGRDLIILLDIDHFKAVNDTYGHAKGDRCLREVARFLQGWLRPEEDILCRYGGEEFAVMLQNTSARFAMQIARTVAAGHRFDLGDGRQINVTFSMGLAEWNRGQTLEEVLKEADVALYCCKQDGRAQAQVFQPSTEDAFELDKGAA